MRVFDEYRDPGIVVVAIESGLQDDDDLGLLTIQLNMVKELIESGVAV